MGRALVYILLFIEKNGIIEEGKRAAVRHKNVGLILGKARFGGAIGRPESQPTKSTQPTRSTTVQGRHLVRAH